MTFVHESAAGVRLESGVHAALKVLVATHSARDAPMNRGCRLVNRP